MADGTLETERLELRPPCMDDLPFVLQEMNTPAMMRYLGDATFPPERIREGLEADISAFAEARWHRWTVWRSEDAVRVGRCGLFRIDTEAAPKELRDQRHIGWMLAQRFRGCGYATEAARAVLDFGFDTMGLPEIYAQTSDSNEASTRMMHRLGFSARPELGYDDPDYPPRDNPTTVWSLRRG